MITVAELQRRRDLARALMVRMVGRAFVEKLEMRGVRDWERV